MQFHDVMTWIVAWERGMADKGWPRARIDIWPDMSYGFAPDKNMLFPKGSMYQEDWEEYQRMIHPGWVDGIKTFMEVDEHFPGCVKPAPLLNELRAGLVTLEDLEDGCPEEH